MQDEKDIIKKVLSGDTDSFKLIVDKYQGLVYSICLNMTRDRFEAENLAQDTFIKVYNSLCTYKQKGFKTWISRIAVNRCLDYKKSAARRYEKLVSPDELNEFSYAHGPPIDEVLVLEEESSTVRTMCERLPDIYRDVVREYFINSKGVRQIADEWGVNVKTVETRLYRGIKILGQRWKEGYG